MANSTHLNVISVDLVRTGNAVLAKAHGNGCVYTIEYVGEFVRCSEVVGGGYRNR